MSLPVTDRWNLANFDATNLSSLLGLSSNDLVLSPSESPYFAFDAVRRLLVVRSSDGEEASLRFMTAVPSRFTFEVVIRCPALPHNLGDLRDRRFGFTLADGEGRGFSMYFAKTGVAISRVDTFGATTALPDTSDVTAQVSSTVYTVRVAVDGGLGRAYVFVGAGETSTPPLRWILPVVGTPGGLGDVFRLFAMGQRTEPVAIEITALRLAGGMVIANYPPIADAGPDRVVTQGQAVRLDGRASYDLEGDVLRYRWLCVDVPYGSTFASELHGASTTDDGDGDGVTPFFSLAPGSIPARAAVGDIVRLAGSSYEVYAIDRQNGTVEVKTDALADSLSNIPLRWIHQSILLNSNSSTPAAVPDLPGIYRFHLYVTDGESESDASEVLVSVTPLATATGIEPDVSPIWKAIGDEWRLVEGRELFEEAWKGVAQILSGKLLEAWQWHYNNSIRDAQRVFQRKWVAFRTFEPETAPDDVVIGVRHGAFLATHDFPTEGPLRLDTSPLTFEVLESDGRATWYEVAFVGGTLPAIVISINQALQGTGVIAEARSLRVGDVIVPDARLCIRANRAFRLFGAAACARLGLPEARINVLAGDGGSVVTNRTYHIPGIDLAAQGVQRYDLLVLNNGEAFSIDRVLSDPSDAHPNERLLLFDVLPSVASTGWSIPSVIHSAEVDYGAAGAYPGDLAKLEVGDDAAVAPVHNAVVVAERGTTLAVELAVELHAALLKGTSLRLLGLKRRKAIPISEDLVSIPTLQEVIPSALEPTLYREHLDYYIEPFYRAATPKPMLQFRDGVFAGDVEPPDVLWAETVLLNNDRNVEQLFGRLVRFMRDDAAGFPRDFNYTAGVAGLLYAQQRGPSLFALAVGAQILLGQPFAEAAGYVEEILPEYSPRRGRILLRNDDGNTPTRSDTVRAYYYLKDPRVQTAMSGLAVNPETGLPWQVGEWVPQFSALGSGIDVDDVYSDPTWWKEFVGTGTISEVEKYHRFVVRFNTELVALSNLELLAGLLKRAAPTYTKPLIAGDSEHVDELDITDERTPQVVLQPFDSLLDVHGYRYDDYLGNGHTSSLFDDGITRFDALIDSVLDLIDVQADIDWPGGTLSFPTEWPFRMGTQAIDVDGHQTGVPGSSFSLTDGMSLAAGKYRTTIDIKAGPVLPPLH